MMKYFLQTQTFTLLTILFFATSCNGQEKQDAQQNNGWLQNIIPGGQPKLIKTQGSGPSDNVRCGLEDKEGNLWFGTTGEGVYRYDGKSFTQFTVKDGLNSNKVWCILEDKSGNIWFGTTDGACRYDGKKIIRIPISENFAPVNSDNNYYSEWATKNTVWSIFQDKGGTIWFGTGDGVYCYNGTFFTRFLDNQSVINKEGLHLKMVDCILEGDDGVIWFASGMPPGSEGVCRYDGKSITSSKPNGDGWIRSMIKDKAGHIWFAGRNHGNFRYDGKTFSNFTGKVGIGNSILSDRNGNIWFSGEEDDDLENVGGIWCYDGKTFKNFTTKDGIGKYSVWSMVEDSKGNIWIGTRNTGLYKYDGKSFTPFSE